jgi:hypothetical protein
MMYKSDKAFNEWDINNTLQRNQGWKPILMTPFIKPLRKVDEEIGMMPVIEFILIFQKEDNEQKT